MNKYIFFTLNDFSKDDGGTIRMRGIVNALAKYGAIVTLISNTKHYYKFHHAVQHVFLDNHVTKRQKRLFQLLLTILPVSFHKYFFKDILKKIDKIIKENNIDRTLLIFFEYLDNSVGYLLKQTELIQNYINDVHGIAPLEFKLKKSATIIGRLENYIKLQLAQKLDQKVITNSMGLWFVSHAMQEYYEILYPTIKNLENKILRDGTSKELCLQKTNKKCIKILHSKYNIELNDEVILFLGDFKDLGGVIDLIEAFLLLLQRNEINNFKLLLVGDGEQFVYAQQMVQQYGLEEKVIFAGRILYSEVRNHQELADVIVCPDKQHQYSELVPHIKYFDSLVSGKVVINGSFQSIKEINIDEKYSIDFQPSNISDLASKIEYALKNLNYLKARYSHNKDIICQKFSYDYSVQVLLD